MEITGYILSVLIGISLAIIGGGGSILTVPLLVYFFNTEPSNATTYSLLIVGITSVVAVILKSRNVKPDFKIALSFGLPSIISVLLARNFIIPAIPESVFTVHNITVTKGMFIMLLFSVVMFTASVSMIRNKPPQKDKHTNNSFKMILMGSLVGLITGIVGVGGGFLIIPALVLYASMDFKKAVVTSLLIIAASSIVGFVGSIQHHLPGDMMLIKVTAAAIAGIFIGVPLATKINSHILKPTFGWFVLAISVAVVYKELSAIM